MEVSTLVQREKIPLIATNKMRIAGIQGVYGDPNGIEIVPITVEAAHQSYVGEVVLIDAGSIEPLFEILDQLRAKVPELRVIVLGVDHDDTYVECVIAAGAKGFLGANATADEFRYALCNVREGSIWATRRVLSRLAETHLLRRTSFSSPPRVSFTARERQIIELLLAGNGNREISECLGIEPVTVKAHLGRIMRKAGVVNRIELTMFAVKHQIDLRRPGPQIVRPMH